jgi:cytochrome P450
MDRPLLDLTDRRNFRNGFPHEFFVGLRAHMPIYWHPPTEFTPDGEGFWVVSRYRDVAAIQRNPETYSSDKGGDRTGGGTALKDENSAGLMLNMTDDPQHRRLRALVNKGFTPRAVDALEAELEARMTGLLDAVAGADQFDFVVAVARELPLQTICSVLGVPQADRAQLCDWIDQGVATASESIIAHEFLSKIRDYGLELIAEKRKRPERDILSTIVHARFEEDGSQLSDRELIAFFNLLFPAGAETTRSAIGGAMQAFIDAPAEFARLKSDPSLMRSAVEEVVRWTTPSVYKRRTATRATEILGQPVAAGDKVTFWEMSANRDERAFDDPFRFDVGRWPNKHLGFGAGVHFCLGASLARMEIKVALRHLCARYSGFEAAGATEWTGNNRLLGLRKLAIRAIPARQ